MSSVSFLFFFSYFISHAWAAQSKRFFQTALFPLILKNITHKLHIAVTDSTDEKLLCRRFTDQLFNTVGIEFEEKFEKVRNGLYVYKCTYINIAYSHWNTNCRPTIIADCTLTLGPDILATMLYNRRQTAYATQVG